MPSLPNLSEVLDELHHYQKIVSELKSIHNKLHEIELHLEGLSATIQLYLPRTLIGKEAPKNSFFKRYTSKPENVSPSFDFEAVQISWELHVCPSIVDLRDFAEVEMEELEDTPFSSASDGSVHGPKWITELVILQNSFQQGLLTEDLKAIDFLSRELLSKCRSHLRGIDKRLRKAIEELDPISRRLSESISHDSTDNNGAANN